MMRLVLFVKNLTGFSYEAAEWLIIGVIAALIALAVVVWAIRRHRRNKARRAAQAAAALPPLNERFVNALHDLSFTSDGNDNAFYVAHNLWTLLGKPRSFAELHLVLPDGRREKDEKKREAIRLQREERIGVIEEQIIMFLRMEALRDKSGTGMSRASLQLKAALGDYRDRRAAAQGGKRPATA